MSPQSWVVSGRKSDGPAAIAGAAAAPMSAAATMLGATRRSHGSDRLIGMNVISIWCTGRWRGRHGSGHLTRPPASNQDRRAETVGVLELDAESPHGEEAELVRGLVLPFLFIPHQPPQVPPPVHVPYLEIGHEVPS